MKQLFSILAFILLQHTLFAQCPIAAGCVPANAPASNYVFGMGIFNVSLGSISYTTSGVQDGYRDYSCTQSTQLVAGNSYPVSVTTNPNANENVRLWIDYNNNGNFEASELAFSSDNKKQHTGTVTVPLTAVQNQPLRLRVSADYIAAPIPTPCSAAQYSQAEDYAVTVVVPTNPPVAAFTVSDTLTCTGSVSFTDQSANSPATWHWDFGDGTTSALRNPSHSYANTGTYSVSLKVCNSLGCDSLLQTNLVRYHNNVPVAAACTPATASYCCKHGILGVEFGSINITSANATAGYEDFTCRQTATFIENNPYQLKIKTDSTTQQDIKVFIDLNNDGQFNLPQEEVVSLSSVIKPQLQYRIPTGAVLNTPLRMRVAADFVGSSFTACSGIQNGQAEDYTIIIAANTNKPNAQFVTSHRTGCDSLVQFTDQSINSPTSWHWDFGDGTSSNQQHPQHLYTQPGLYQVRLITCNSFGCDTAFVSNPLAMAIPCRQYCSSKNHINKVNW
ncbi:MAG: PKD domain-containing protein, partial [Hymenobacteraceae bacterium]|nr:PKD domain-containing protein [Hymenobacteraceae bacterium]MDX5397251.1 PKD domain-containing protein [Hymenobacteraceae bacterium]MDX5442313.1 PKD domain-containing protein [Hymenobacteraceae bacterium]MDX5513329.1 PKD domain-containing protein [Hymenobacteraceae bacterium]